MATKTRVIIVRKKETNSIHYTFFYEISAVLEIIRPKEIWDTPPTNCAQPHTSQLLNFLLSALCRVLYSVTRLAESIELIKKHAREKVNFFLSWWQKKNSITFSIWSSIYDLSYSRRFSSICRQGWWRERE